MKGEVSDQWSCLCYETQPPFDPALGCSHLQEGAGVVVLCHLFCYAALPPSPTTDQVNAKSSEVWRKMNGRSSHVVWKKTTTAPPRHIRQSMNELLACKTVSTDINWYLLFTLWAELLTRNRSYSLSPFSVVSPSQLFTTTALLTTYWLKVKCGFVYSGSHTYTHLVTTISVFQWLFLWKYTFIWKQINKVNRYELTFPKQSQHCPCSLATRLSWIHALILKQMCHSSLIDWQPAKPLLLTFLKA